MKPSIANFAKLFGCFSAAEPETDPLIGSAGRYAPCTGVKRSAGEIRAELAKRLTGIRGTLKSAGAFELARLPSGAKLAAIDFGHEAMADGPRLVHLAEAALVHGVASLAVPHGRVKEGALDWLLSGKRTAPIVFCDENSAGGGGTITITTTSRARPADAKSLAGVIDLVVDLNGEHAVTSTMSIHELPVNERRKCARHAGDALATGARYGRRREDGVLGLALINEHGPANQRMALAAIGHLQNGGTVDGAAEAIKAAKDDLAAYRRAQRTWPSRRPDAGQTLPPAPPSPSPSRPPSPSPSPSACPALSPTIKLPLSAVTPALREMWNEQAFKAVREDPSVKQAMGEMIRRMTRPTGVKGWLQRVAGGDKPEAFDKLARELARAVDAVLAPVNKPPLGGPGEPLSWLREQSVRRLAEQSFQSLPERDQGLWRLRTTPRRPASGFSAARERLRKADDGPLVHAFPGRPGARAAAASDVLMAMRSVAQSR